MTNPGNPNHHRIQRIAKISSSLRRLASSPLPSSGSSQNPRIGLIFMRRLAAHSNPPGGFWEFSRNTKNEQNFDYAEHHIHTV